VEHRIRHTRISTAGLTRHRRLTSGAQPSVFAPNVAFECAGCFEAVLVGSPVRHGERAGGSTIEPMHVHEPPRSRVGLCRFGSDAPGWLERIDLSVQQRVTAVTASRRSEGAAQAEAEPVATHR
jgi:hypothetical protein